MMVRMADGDGDLIQQKQKSRVYTLNLCLLKNVGHHGERLSIQKGCGKSHLLMDT